MYNFVYDGLYKEYCKNFKIHYSDTDSTVVELLNNEKLHKIKDYIHPTELGKFADVEPNHNIIKFIGLKSKMYDIIKQNKTDGKLEENKKAKGIKKI